MWHIAIITQNITKAVTVVIVAVVAKVVTIANQIDIATIIVTTAYNIVAFTNIAIIMMQTAHTSTCCQLHYCLYNANKVYSNTPMIAPSVGAK